VKNNNLKHLPTRQPTYWPSDPNKIPDLVDFCVTKGIDTKKKFTVESCLELTSDHTTILINTVYVYSHTRKIKETVLIQQKDRLNCFRETLDELITLEITLKTEIAIEEAVENITKAIQKAAWQTTPD
jgi:hypothetical protein